MSTRAYDYIVQVSDSTSFTVGNIVIGSSTNAVGEIIAIESSNLKIRTSNLYVEYTIGERLISNAAILYSQNTFIDHSASIDGSTNSFATPTTVDLRDTVTVYVNGLVAPRDSYTISSSTIQFLPVQRIANTESGAIDSIVFPTDDITSLLVQVVRGNIESANFVASNIVSYVETSNSAIVNIFSAPYIAEKNSFEQTPLVKLYSIYYPGEWYPKNTRGNPSGFGDTFPWAYNFPLRYAEVAGETFSDFNYSVVYGNEDYKVTALESSEIGADSSGQINEISLAISNFDGFIASIVDDVNISGFNSTNSTVAFVNGELVQNIDPRTVSSNIHYNSAVAAARGANAAHDYNSTLETGGTWIPFKRDSRDLLDAIVEVKLTYAKFLDYWPEYSVIKSTNITENSMTVYSSGPYRIGDVITSNSNPTERTTIVGISANKLFCSNSEAHDAVSGDKLYIVNPDADKNAYVEHIFTINRLDELDELKASFNLSNWLQYFKNRVPTKKFFITTCPFRYKGEECKYPANGSGTIVGSNPALSANGYFTASNATTLNLSEDICGKTLTACALRRNLINFGGFPGASL
jgi:phage-related protein